MRLRLVLKTLNEKTFIPFNYSQFIHAMILDKLSFADPEYAQEVHDGRGFKFFTFSEIDIPKRRLDKERKGLDVISDTVSLIISSPQDRFLKAFLSGILCKPEMNIGPAGFMLESANTLETPDFSLGKAIFKTLSPIVASTMREINGKLRSWDLMPEDAKFYDNLRKNLIRKYQEFHGKPPSDENFEVKVIKPLRPKRIQVKNEFHTGSRMIFEVSGNSELILFAYECGLGERNSMGFGMVAGR